MAGLTAATLSTLVQLVLWLLAGEDAKLLLLRDIRLTAALVVGPHVLPPPLTFDESLMSLATVIHLLLSFAYAGLLFPFRSSRLSRALLTGALFGVVLYVVNLHGFTWVFPWFSAARGVITLIAHAAFSMSVMSVYWILVRRAGSREP